VSDLRTESERDGVEGPILPPELPWILLAVPLPAAYLMGHDLLDKSLPLLLRALLKMYLPFMAFGGTFLLLYAYAMPSVLRRVTTPLARAAVHVAAMLLVVAAVSVPLYPLLFQTSHPSGLLGFMIVSTIFSAACIFPAIVVQGLRLRARSAEHRALVERKAALEAQLQALQARTDPHFLFNSLNTVASLIPEDPVLAERTLERLADLFRYALEAGRVRTVRLERELAMVSDYLELQTARFGERLQTRLEVASGLEEVPVPPLLLQPLVENAILHGAARGRGARVDVTVRREHDRLIIEVSDDGPGPGQSVHAGSGTSVRGVEERLRLHYAEAATLSLEARASGGCLAKLALPIAGPV
jgi:two-component system sensor histidine kinase AlgZ